MPDAVAQLTTQKASAALGAAIAGPMLLEPMIARFVPGAASPLVGVGVGLGLVWAGAALLDGHLESIVIGAGVGLAAKSALRLVLKVDTPST